MVTPEGPACDQCHKPLPGGYGYVSFFFCQMICCSRECLDTAETERLRAFRAEEYSMKKHGYRHWKVVDGNGDLVCITLYKKGAAEVIRRLTLRRPRPFRNHGRLCGRQAQAAPQAQTSVPATRKRCAKAA